MSTNIKAVGVPGRPGSDGSVPLRREVRELQSRFPDQWNLYMLGLEAFQGMDENNITSYYQLAGIHGMPYKPYNGVAGLPGASGGYCTHSSTIFLTWHRPYLSLVEQVLYAIIQDIARKFTGSDNAKYVAAAKDFRLPYYDWAAQPSGLPSALTAATVNVIDGNGKRQMANPLASFKFHPMNPSPGDFSASWSRFPATARYPDSKGNSRNGQVASALSTMTAALRTSVVVVLAIQNYNAFSNNRWLKNQQPGEYGSVENIHDAIHGAIGGGGHMSALDVSAYDPIFWLHHCNVDRLWAIWGALNPNSYVEPGAVGSDSFTAKTGTIEDVNTQLKPFWDGSGTKFWNSTGVKETITFNYAYPETQKWKFANVADYQRSVKSTVAQLYGTGNVVRDFIASGAIKSLPTTSLFTTQKAVVHGGASIQRTVRAAAPVGEAQAPMIQVENDIGPDTPTLPSALTTLATAKTYTEYITNLRAEKHGLDQTFTVYIFLGDFNPDPQTWPFEYNTVGRFTVLGRAPDTPCTKCLNDAADRLVVTGTVPLTSALLQDIVAGSLSGLSTEEVVPHLVRNLHWRIVGFDGVEIAREGVPGLKVAVCSTVVGVGEGGGPVYDGEWVTHREVSDGRPGGLGGDDEV
ncbi:hypothetical protein Vi05172_g3981 [Venturia inaequalis]|nr:hypothetical protein Vi05172_g3981 [Venturia inaequalis]